MSKSLDLIIGADKLASIQQLEADLKQIKLSPIEIATIQLSSGAITSLQKSIQDAIDAGKYTVSFNASQNNQNGNGKSGSISAQYAQRLADNERVLNSKNYVKELENLNLPLADITKFSQELQNVQTLYKSVSSSSGGFGSLNYDDAEKLVVAFKEISSSFNELKNLSKLNDIITNDTIEKLNKYKNTLLDIDAYRARAQKAGIFQGDQAMGATQEEESRYLRQEQILTRIEQIKNRIDNESQTEFLGLSESEAKSLANELDNLLNKFKQIQGEVIKPKFDQNAEQTARKLSERISDILEKYPNLQKQLPEAFNRLKAIQSEIVNEETFDPSRVKDMTTEVGRLEEQIIRTGAGAETLGNKIRKHIVSQLGNMLIALAARAFRQSFGELYSNIKEIDKAMTELKKVTDLTAQSYSSFLDRASAKSRELGTSISDYVNATADFARLGYSLADAENLAVAATVYKNVGDGIENVADASESIISTMKAFNIEAENSMDIVDAFNEVGNKYAISSTGIGQALGNSASALAAANNDISESIALVVAGNDVVQNPQKVGTALKTISMFLRAAKTDAENAGESTEGMANSISELREEIKSLTGDKVDIMIDDKTFKSTYEIMKDLSKVWDELSDVSQANIIELIGGKRNANVVTSILNNFSDAEAVVKTIANDAGSALKEQNKWLNSIEGKTNQLKSASQGLSLDIINSETVKDVVSALTRLVDVLDFFARHQGVVVGAIGVLGGGLILKNVQSIATALLNAKSAIGEFAKTLNPAFITSIKNFGKLSRNASDKIIEESNALKNNKMALEGNQQQLKLHKEVTDEAAVASAKFAVVLGLITVAISIAAIGISIYNQHVQKEISNAQKLSEEYSKSTQSLKEYYDQVETLRKELGDTEVGTDEHKGVEEELLKIQTEITDQYGLQAQGIDLINDSLDTTKQKLEEISEAEAKSYLMKNRGNMDTISSQIDLGQYRDVFKGIGFVPIDFDANEFNKIFNGIATKDGLGYQFNYGTDIYEAIDAFEELYDAVSKRSPNSSYLTWISEQMGKLDEIQEKVDETANAYTNAFLLADPRANIKIGGVSISTQYNEFLQAQTDLAEAIEKGDNQAIQNAYSKMLSIDEWYRQNENSLKQQDKVVAAYLGNMFRDAVSDAMNTTVETKIELAIAEGDIEGVENLKTDAAKFLDSATAEFSIANFNLALNDETNELHSTAIRIKSILDVLGIDINDFAKSKPANPIAGWADDINGISQELKSEVGSILVYINSGGKITGDIANKTQVLVQKVKNAVSGNKELAGTFKDLEGTGVLEWFAQLCGMVDLLKQKTAEANEKTSTLRGTLSSLSNMSDSFDALTKVFEDVKDKGTFSWDDLEKLAQSEFGGLDSFEEFLEVISKYPNNLSKCQAAFNKLTREYIEEKGVLDLVNEGNAELITKWLKARGVANAQALVQNQLTLSTHNLGDATLAEAANLIKESKESDSTKKSLAQLYLAKLNLNKVEIKTSGDVQNLINLAKTAGYTTKEISNLIRAKELLAEAEEYERLGLAPEFIAELREGADALIKEQEFDSDKFYSTFAGGDASNGGSKNTGSTGSSSSEDKYLEAWKERVEVQKHLVEMDKQTKEDYINWLRKYYKEAGGLANTAANRKKYASEIRSIEEEIYEFDKEKVQNDIEKEEAALENKRVKGLISETEYQKELAKINEEGYKKLLKQIQDKDLYSSNEKERLDAENEILGKIKDAHIAAYEAEITDLDHLRAMELITDEQYYAKRTALMKEYYAGEEMYRDELKKEEEELFKERTDLIKKYSEAAKRAISSIMDVGKSLADALGDLVEGIIEANSSNFDLQKKQLQHQLDMNYITEEEYYEKLEKLYKTYYKSKSIYLDEFWENQEEVYQHELDSMEDGASALEDIHARVVDLIKSEIEDAKDAIEDEKDAYLKLIDIRRKALEEEQDENDTERSRVAKLNEIAELTRQLNALRNDNSAEGQRRYQEILAKLIEARRDLQEFEEEQAYKAATDQLDKDAEAIEKKADEDTKELEDKLDDNEWLVNEAWARLKGMNEDLYNDLMNYVRKHSTTIKDEVTGSWETASKAFDGYKDNLENGYRDIELMLAHPELYYRGIEKEEADYDASIVKQKEMENYAEVLGDFAEDIADIMGTSVSAVADILNTLFPGYITDLLVDGADMFSSSLGIVGINNSLLSTVAALGGIAGIIDMMNGFEELAEGNTENHGIAIGGENINSVLSLLSSIESYESGLLGNSNEVSGFATAIIQAIAGGPTDSSSVVTGITTLGAVAVALLGLGTTLVNGGGSGTMTLISLLQGLSGLVNLGNINNAQDSTRLVTLINILTAVCNYTANLLDSSEALGFDFDILRTLLYNGWRGIFEILSRIAGYTSTDTVGVLLERIAGLVVSGNSGVYSKITNDTISLLTENLARVISGGTAISGGSIGKFAEIGGKIPTSAISSGDKNVTVNPVFNIQSSDPQGVANEIERLLPQIASFTINAMVDAANNKGVKRSASSLV